MSRPSGCASRPSRYARCPSDHASCPSNHASRPSAHTSRPSRYASRPSRYACSPFRYGRCRLCLVPYAISVVVEVDWAARLRCWRGLVALSGWGCRVGYWLGFRMRLRRCVGNRRGRGHPGAWSAGRRFPTPRAMPPVLSVVTASVDIGGFSPRVAGHLAYAARKSGCVHKGQSRCVNTLCGDDLSNIRS